MKNFFYLFVLFNFLIYADSGRDFSFSGNLSNDFTASENLGTRNSATFYFTWSDNFVYLGFNGGNTSANPSDKFYFAIDINPGTSTGTTNTFGGLSWTGSTQDENNKPDYAFLWRNNNGGGQFLGNGTSGSWNTSGKAFNEWVVWGNPGGYEVKIPWSELGGSKPTNFSIWFWTNNSGDSWVWSALPNDIPNGAGTQIANSKFYFSNTGSGISPNSILSTPLPVELNSFLGKSIGNKVRLDWSTASEINNSGFEVQRSVDNKDWAKVSFVAGFGNSNSTKEYSYTDEKVSLGQKYYYRLKQIDNDGSFEFSKVVEVVTGNMLNGFTLDQNYPNPFNPSTTIRFGFQEPTKANLKIYDAIGNEVAELFDGTADAGRIYDVQFNASGLSSGIYFYKLVSDTKTDIKKMMLVK